MLYGPFMSDQPEQSKPAKSAKALAAEQREERLRKQLRANLQRRKAQSKSRAQTGDNSDEKEK
jgi:hypothetical protein